MSHPELIAVETAMTTPIDASPPNAASSPGWVALAKAAVVWAAFLGFIYLTRDFFFTAFMTFLLCSLILSLVARGMKWFSRDRERPWLRKLLTLGVIAGIPLICLVAFSLIAPQLVEQAQHMSGWLSQMNPETEASRLVEGVVAPYIFRQHYPSKNDPDYQKDLEQFRQTGDRHVTAYRQFPTLEAWVEGGFDRHFSQTEKTRLRAELARKGTSSPEFATWFVQDKAPKLKQQALEQAKQSDPAPMDPLLRSAATASREKLLDLVRLEPTTLANLREEWVKDTLARDVILAKSSKAYQTQFHDYYERFHVQSRRTVPYTFDQYVALRDARRLGDAAFAKVLDGFGADPVENSEDRLANDFESFESHELFQSWWDTNSAAKYIRSQIASNLSGKGAERIESILTSLINIPVDLLTALLLSLFICLDFPTLKRGARSLRDTWLRDAYDQLAPALSGLSGLVGRALQAQALIALCNASMMYAALLFFGVEHAVMLALCVLVLCMVPTLGIAIASVLLMGVALLQPGGGPVLVLKVLAAVVVVMAMESFVLSPRIVGRMMELHPVLSIAILPLAQSFFGVWGLILSTPVAVYVIHALILRQGLPGSAPPHEALTAQSSEGHAAAANGAQVVASPSAG